MAQDQKFCACLLGVPYRDTGIFPNCPPSTHVFQNKYKLSVLLLYTDHRTVVSVQARDGTWYKYYTTTYNTDRYGGGMQHHAKIPHPLYIILKYIIHPSALYNNLLTPQLLFPTFQYVSSSN